MRVRGPRSLLFYGRRERGLFYQPVRSFNGDEYILNAGDCIYIDANTDHSYHKLGDEECVSVWVYASPMPRPWQIPLFSDNICRMSRSL